MSQSPPSRLRPGRQARRAPRPRYRQIADRLIDEIRVGHWQVGDKLPGDIELTRRFGVGRHTVRAALQQIEELGLIQRRPRIGTILRSTTPAEAYTHSVTSSAGLLQYPDNTPLRIMNSEPIRVDRKLAGVLRLPLGSRWHRISAVRESPDRGAPLCCVDVYLLPELAAVEKRLRRDSTRIFEHIERMTGRRVARVTISLHAGAIDGPAAALLGVADGSPVLAITRRFYDDDGVLFEVSHSRHPAGRFGYELELARNWRPADGSAQ